jgi:hypothetical protein
MRSALVVAFVIPLLLTAGCFFGLDGSLVGKKRDASISEGGGADLQHETGPDISTAADLPAIDLPVADQPITEGGTDLEPGEGGTTDGPDLGAADSTGGG